MLSTGRREAQKTDSFEQLQSGLTRLDCRRDVYKWNLCGFTRTLVLAGPDIRNDSQRSTAGRFSHGAIMNRFPLRRIAAFSALAALSLSAAAQSDAAFASARGKLASGLATMAQLKTQPQQPAVPAPVGEPVDAKAWKNIQRLALDRGTYSAPSAGNRLSRYTHETQSTDPKAEYQRMTLDASGYQRDGTFATAMVAFTARTVTATTTQVRVETWLFITDNRGRLLEGKFQTVTKGLDGKVAVAPVVPLDCADPKVAARYARIIKYWSN